MEKRMYYFQVVGKNIYIPMCVKTKAESIPDAKINFYVAGGSDVNYVIRISKKQYLNN